MKSKFKIIFLSLLVVAAIFALTAGNKILETNEAGFYQVRQVFWVGKLKVRNEAGTYGRWLGKITTYEMVKDLYLSKQAEDSEDGQNTNENIAERVLFPNGYADVNFVGSYELSLEEPIQIELHRMYNNDDNVAYMVKQQIIEALKNTGTLMSAEEAYSSKRSEFIALAREQALNGLYKAHVENDTVSMGGGQTAIVKKYSVERDEFGNPIILKESLLARYKIKLPQYNVKDMDFDPKLLALIDSRKEAQLAEQEAITKKARGEALIAEEKATQEVDKIKQVTIAEKNKAVAILDAEKLKEVALQNRLAEEENKKAVILKAEAKKQELLIADGLSERERYILDMQKETAIGVARETFGGKGINFPQIIVNGEANGKGVVDPFTAVGLESFKNMVNPKNLTGSSTK